MTIPFRVQGRALLMTSQSFKHVVRSCDVGFGSLAQKHRLPFGELDLCEGDFAVER